MISQTLPAAASLQPWNSADTNVQQRGRHGHVHNGHPRAVNSESNNAVKPEANASVSTPSMDRFTRQSPEVQAVDSSVKIQDFKVAMSNSFNFEMKTKEGDVVTIAYNKASNYQESNFSANNAKGSIQGYQSEFSSNTNFQISISGDLNEEEQKSLKDLMQQIEKVGQKFFQGDVKTAFQQAQKIGFDTEQIAGFSMSLNMEKSVRAVSAYQQVSEQQPVDNQTLKQAGDFYNQTVQALADKMDVLQLFAEPNKVFDQISSGITDALASQTQELPDLQQHTDTLKKLLSQFANSTLDTANTNVSEQTSKPDDLVAPVEV